MHAEILSIGDEITSGQLLDTNSQWLSQRCEELGIRVLYHTSVGDDLEALVEVIRLAIRRSDVIVATGGLGPTADDLTRQAMADAVGQPLVLDPQALEHIRALFARRKRPMPKQNEVQALFPRGARMIHNPHGTAPGIVLETKRERGGACHLFSLPGVPAEMREMWPQVADALGKLGEGSRTVLHRKINCFGAGESQIESMLPDLIRRGRTPRVGINASQATIILRITAEGATQADCLKAMEPTLETIHRSLGHLVFGEGDDQLQHAVVRLLAQKGKTLATCEWGTGGLVADWLNEVGGAQAHFLGGLASCNPSAFRQMLDTAPGNADAPSKAEAVDAEAVGTLAAGCRKRFGADLALAVGPFPPFDAQAAEPKPLHLALATSARVSLKSIPFALHPALLRVYAAKQALNMVRLALLEK